MTHKTNTREIVGIVGLIVLLLAFFVLLYNPYLGWGLVTISAVIIAASLYTKCFPGIKP